MKQNIINKCLKIEQGNRKNKCMFMALLCATKNTWYHIKIVHVCVVKTTIWPVSGCSSVLVFSIINFYVQAVQLTHDLDGHMLQ